MPSMQVSSHTTVRRPASPPRRDGQFRSANAILDHSLRALGRSQLTRDQYLMSVGQMVDYFDEHGMPDEPTKITRERVETFLADFAETHMLATAQGSSQ